MATTGGGKYLRDFNFDPNLDQEFGEPLAKMVRAYHGLINASGIGRARSEELARDKHFTPEGRKAQQREWLRKDAAAALRAAREAMQAGIEEMHVTRSSMVLSGIDKTDVAAAILRGEVRAWLRGLEPAKRAAMLSIGDLDPTISQAILEAPAELTGVSAPQREKLGDQVLVAQHPKAAQKIARFEEGMQLLAEAERVVARELASDAGIAVHDLRELAGEKTLRERLDEKLRAGGFLPEDDRREEAA